MQRQLFWATCKVQLSCFKKKLKVPYMLIGTSVSGLPNSELNASFSLTYT